jgi:Tol biopolymer transport system component
LQTGTNERASLSGEYPFFSTVPGTTPAISSNGQLVAFQGSSGSGSQLDNDIYLHDFQTGTKPPTNLTISLNYFGYFTGNGTSIQPFFSPDARWVFFLSDATDLLATNLPFGRRLFARDLITATTRLISGAPDGAASSFYRAGAAAAVSTDSRYVTWVSGKSNVFVTRMLDQSQVLICSNCQNPSIGGDGRLVAYETLPSASNPFSQVFVRDLQSGATNLVSISRAGGPGAGQSSNPQISPDGRFVIFASKAPNLVDNDTNGVSDIFVRDRLLGATILVSLNAQGTGAGNSASSKPLMAADGRTVVFQSFASDLIAGDYNDRRDIFVLRLGGVDSDGDGLDDDWEMTYFGDLSRDGAGDFDHDGQTDREEFLAGTNPTSDESLLRVITVSSINGGNTTLIWLAVPGRTYRVQFKDSVEEAEWKDLPSDVTATASTASAVDSTGTQAHRFYRVLRLP